MWPDKFDARTVDPWLTPAVVQPTPRPDFADNEELKKAFGVALGQGLEAFEAGLKALNNDTAKGLWAAINWINDPLVIASKDAYLKSLKKLEKPLDKEELLSEVLSAARLAPEDKDKAALFKLYSDIAGFTGKASPDILTNTVNNTNNLMKIVLVKSDMNKDDAKIAPTQSKIQNEELLLPKLKLVSGSSA